MHRSGEDRAKTVRVTSAQVNAAKLKIKLSVTSGRFVSPGVHAVANAKRVSSPNGTSSRAGEGSQATG